MHGNPYLISEEFGNINDSILLAAYLPMAELLLRVCGVISDKQEKYRTERAYPCWIKRLILFRYKRHLQEMGEEEVQQSLAHVAVYEDVKAGI